MDFDEIKSVFVILGVPAPSQLVLLEAATLQSAHVLPYPPDCPALLTGVSSRELAAQVKEVLLWAYPKDHVVIVADRGERKEGALDELEKLVDFSEAACLFVPALPEGTSFESFAEIVAHLRAPNGCPWDREQTHESLRKHLLEETYESLTAIDSGDLDSMREEFGDLTLQVLMHTQIATEAGEFKMPEVLKHIHDKLVRRHPHVFGDVAVSGVGDVLANWEKLKEGERKTKGEKQKGLLDGIPAALPALSQAQEYQDRAARVGFDWPEIEGVLDKIAEEIQEIKVAKTEEELTGELGDLFFALVNLARWRKVDAESALRGTNVKFKSRLAYVANGAKAQGRELSEMSLEEMDALWEEGKKVERGE